MNPSLRIIASLLALCCAQIVGAGPSHGQFEEADTAPRLGVGGVIEVSFRGDRATLPNGSKIGFDNGPAFGARVEYRLTRTLTFGVLGTWARTEEKVTSVLTGDALFAGDFTVIQGVAELLVRVKPSVPGYFILGGGVSYVQPDPEDPDDSTTIRFSDDDSFTEPIVLLGAGLEFLIGHSGAVRPEARWYVSPPADLAADIDSDSIEIDFVLAFSFVYKL